MSGNKLKQFAAQRQACIDRIDNLEILAHSALNNTDIRQRFKIRYNDLSDIIASFHKYHQSIIDIVALTEDPDLKYEQVILNRFDENVSIIKCHYSTLFETAVSNSKENGVIYKPNVKLPKIDLPKFDGKLSDWPTFINLFTNLVHKNDNLSNSEKYHFLITSLSKNPLSLVKTLPLTDDNYPVAFNALNERYQNQRVLANTYWQEIVEFPKIRANSSNDLMNLLDCVSENLEALRTLKLPVDQWDFVIFNIVIKKLDQETVTRFELESASKEIPSYRELEAFLKRQCTALESIAINTHSKFLKTVSNKNSFGFNKSKTHSFNTVLHSNAFTNDSSCYVCKSPHFITRCSIFLNKSPFERYQFSKRNNLCLKCLNSSHKVAVCTSKINCDVCKSKHNTLLHYAPTPNSTVTSNNSSSKDQPQVRTNEHENSVENNDTLVTAMTCSTAASSSVHSLTSSLLGTVLLSTALIEVKDGFGNFQIVRVLLDSASQASFITEKCCKRLGLQRMRMNLDVFGLGSSLLNTKHMVTFIVQPRGKLDLQLTVDAVVLPKICTNLPNKILDVSKFSHLLNLNLADPNFHIPNKIELLLGADLFPLILGSGQIVGSENSPSAFNTIFGWVVMGKIPTTNTRDQVNSFHISTDINLTDSMKRFWELEEIPETNCVSPEDSFCEDHFVKTHSRDDSGRFTVSLPFKTLEPTFGDSRSIALRRFYSLEKRLHQDSSLFQAYSEFIKEYLELKHMEEVEKMKTLGKVYYIPHHCVLKPDSTTTRLRVVYDASCKVDGVSLNDTLFSGPKLQQNLAVLLLRFRYYKIVFTADIKQMYRQIWIHPNDRNYQRILWRFSPTEKVREFQLNTVTYGISSSPFLAIRTILQLAKEAQLNFPDASKILTSDIYIDDIISGAGDVDKGLALQKELIQVLKGGGFELRKWASNHSSLISSLPSDFCQQEFRSFDDSTSNCCSIKILGLKWLPNLDIFRYDVEALDRGCTKRIILSELARIFDPLGFLAPVTFFVKHLIQHFWCLGLDWEETPPQDVTQRWTFFKSQLNILSKIQIQRVLCQDNFSSCTLHGFGDSSEKGYAAVVYFRFVDSGGQVHISLVCSKTKVSPLKKITLPRLELCAAVLLAKLVSFVIESFADLMKIEEIYAWLDSTIALSWIKSSPHRWKTFVSNRVSFIQDRISPSCWNYVSTSENPADCASRGLMPHELLDHPLWWSGPNWLKLAPNQWPRSEIFESNIESHEEKILSLPNFLEPDDLELLLNKFSSLSKIERIVAYCFRFIYNSRFPRNKAFSPFDQFELRKSLHTLIKFVQCKCFAEEIANLKSGKLLTKDLMKFSPFLDAEGIVRVGGRLKNSDLSFDQRHPILLPRDIRLSQLIIERVHHHNMHPGLQSMQHLIRQNFWILGIKRAIRSVVSKCIICFKTQPKTFAPLMGNLPKLRVSKLKPFSCVGTDFCGPFEITMSKVRGAKKLKSYLCLFVCFATKAIHLELAVDLSTEAFLRVLHRFIARRGRCSQIFSDCGTNFVAANKYLIEIMKNVVESEKICWSFNPPSAPHFGGLWEAGVKSVKRILYRVIGEQTLTFEELSTVFIQIEAQLNSRPICAISPDPNDLTALTPGHFLNLEPVTVLPEPDVTALPINRLNRYQLLLKIHQSFWKRWHREYLNTLIQRNKWYFDDPKRADNTLVLIVDNNLPPLRWKLGRIIKLYPGNDGISRVATVRTQAGTFQRPLVKLCPLPTTDNK